MAWSYGNTDWDRSWHSKSNVTGKIVYNEYVEAIQERVDATGPSVTMDTDLPYKGVAALQDWPVNLQQVRASISANWYLLRVLQGWVLQHCVHFVATALWDGSAWVPLSTPAAFDGETGITYWAADHLFSYIYSTVDNQIDPTDDDTKLRSFRETYEHPRDPYAAPWSWEYDMMEHGHIIGGWIFADLKAALNELVWVENSTDWTTPGSDNKREAVGGHGSTAYWSSVEGNPNAVDQCTQAWNTGTFNWTTHPTEPADGNPFGGRTDSTVATAAQANVFGKENPGSVSPADITAEAVRVHNFLRTTLTNFGAGWIPNRAGGYYFIKPSAQTGGFDDQGDTDGNGAALTEDVWNYMDYEDITRQSEFWDSEQIGLDYDTIPDNFGTPYGPGGWKVDSNAHTVILDYRAFTEEDGGFVYQ